MKYDPSTGEVSIEVADLGALYSYLKQRWSSYKLGRRRFRSVKDEDLFRAIRTAVNYLLNDRIHYGVGAGGWGVSDKHYIRHLYGEEAAQQAKDSVMTSVVVLESVWQFMALWESSGDSASISNARSLRERLLPGLNDYLSQRWNDDKGYGGGIAWDREMEARIVPSYRHTAWLLSLWQTLPGRLGASSQAIQYLLNTYRDINWPKEKIATAVAALSALRRVRNNELCQTADQALQVGLLIRFLEDQISEAFDVGISGWTSGISREGGRQCYTLFTLAEMNGALEEMTPVLRQRLTVAMEESLRGKWRGACDNGMPLIPGGPPDVSMSCLTASALFRKRTMTNKEQDSFDAIVRFVVGEINRNNRVPEGVYSWCLSYFVKDSVSDFAKTSAKSIVTN